ncbi:MAG: PRC-barrel domain-containing protein [Rhizonema sp. PD37]|nr:PRC-barrel domain-containing protein [Rhizonema sp. PD37]
MRRGSDAFGRSVIAYDTGKRIARVEDLVFAETSNKLVGILLTEARLFSSAQVIPFSSIQAFGPDVIVVPNKSAIKRVNQVSEIKKILKHSNILKGTRIVTTNGRNLGTMVDLYFDDKTGEVEGYDVSGGLFADAYSGRSFVPAPHTLHIGTDVTFVPPEVADMMEEQVGGIRGVMQTAAEKLQEQTQIATQTMQLAAQGANDKLQETTQAVNDKLQETTQVVNDKIQETTQAVNNKIQEVALSGVTSLTNTVVSPEEQKAFAIGKTVKEDIFTNSGILVIARDQLVTTIITEEAEHLGVLDQVYRATGGSLSAPINQKFHSSTLAAQERLQQTTEIASEKLLETKRTSMASLTNTAVDPVEQKIFVVGKTVNQAVMAPDGTQLVNIGDLVTPLVAEVADSLGVLDQLYRATGGSLTVKLSRAANTALASQTISLALGRRVQGAVRTEDGIFIAAPGQIVTEQVIERAKTHRKESELLNAVGLTKSEAARLNASGFLSETSEQIRGGATQAQISVGNLWERLLQKFTSLQDSNAETIEKQRIKYALGLPVTRVILSLQDDVILNVGELITHQAIKSARQSGVLDILLSSVYDKKPEISTQELRSPQVGSASLKQKEHVTNGREKASYQ